MARTVGQFLAGECVSWDVEKGFGWIACEDGGPHLFAHHSAVVVDGDKYKAIQPGTLVTCVFGHNAKGKEQAQTITSRDGTPLLGFLHKKEANQLINPLTWEIPPEEKKEPTEKRKVKIVKRRSQSSDSGWRGERKSNPKEFKTKAFREQANTNNNNKPATNPNNKREREAPIPTNWDIKELEAAAQPGSTPEEFVSCLCKLLEESNVLLVTKIVEYVGIAKAVDLVRRTEATQAEGGLPVPPDKRVRNAPRPKFRTHGGVFIHLARQEAGDAGWKAISAAAKVPKPNNNKNDNHVADNNTKMEDRGVVIHPPAAAVPSFSSTSFPSSFPASSSSSAFPSSAFPSASSAFPSSAFPSSAFPSSSSAFPSSYVNPMTATASAFVNPMDTSAAPAANEEPEQIVDGVNEEDLLDYEDL